MDPTNGTTGGSSSAVAPPNDVNHDPFPATPAPAAQPPQPPQSPALQRLANPPQQPAQQGGVQDQLGQLAREYGVDSSVLNGFSNVDDARRALGMMVNQYARRSTNAPVSLDRPNPPSSVPPTPQPQPQPQFPGQFPQQFPGQFPQQFPGQPQFPFANQQPQAPFRFDAENTDPNMAAALQSMYWQQQQVAQQLQQQLEEQRSQFEQFQNQQIQMSQMQERQMADQFLDTMDDPRFGISGSRSPAQERLKDMLYSTADDIAINMANAGVPMFQIPTREQRLRQAMLQIDQIVPRPQPAQPAANPFQQMLQRQPQQPQSFMPQQAQLPPQQQFPGQQQQFPGMQPTPAPRPDTAVPDPGGTGQLGTYHQNPAFMDAAKAILGM